MPDLTTRLEAICERLLQQNVKITTRAIMEHSDDLFRYTTAITRPKECRVIYLKYQKLQADAEKSAKRAEKSSKDALVLRLQARDAEIAELKQQRELFLAAFAAVLQSVQEVHGISGVALLQRKFSQVYDAMLANGLMPTGQVVPMQKPEILSSDIRRT